MAIIETPGDAVLSVFVDINHGSECNISSAKSIQEVATTLFVVQTLNKMKYVPSTTIGLRLYETCNDQATVYKQALVSAVDFDCSTHHDLGLLIPEQYSEILQPFHNLGVLPVNSYAPPNLTLPLIEALVDFVGTKYATVGQLLTSSPVLASHFLEISREAGICLKRSGEIEPNVVVTGINETSRVVVAIGDYDEIAAWLSDFETVAEIEEDLVWIVLPLDVSLVDDMLPEGSYIIKPEQLAMGLGDDLFTTDALKDVPVSVIQHSPQLLGIGKAILEIANELKELRTKSCPDDETTCVIPKSELKDQGKSVSNVELYKTLQVPEKSDSIRYIVSRKINGELEEQSVYQIDVTGERPLVEAEKDVTQLPSLCTKKQIKNCAGCANFNVHKHHHPPSDKDKSKEGKEVNEENVTDKSDVKKGDEDDEEQESEEEDQSGILKSSIWVYVYLTLVALGCLASIGVLIFVVHRFMVEEILDGNPALTIVLIIATIMTLLSVILFCLEDVSFGAEWLNSRKIYVSTLSFGLIFSVMLTRALFLAFSTVGVLNTQHINGYLQSLMLLFMVGVEFSIATMYLGFSDFNSAEVMRSCGYLLLLGYDVILLLGAFISCSYISKIQRNYREGLCFAGTSVGLLLCWTIWLTCFTVVAAEDRDAVVASGLLCTAWLIVIGILVPRTYFMYDHYAREKNVVGRFEISDLGPDPRMNNAARQGLDLQGHQPFYDYVTADVQQQYQQAQPQPQGYRNTTSSFNPLARLSFRRRNAEPRHMPAYNNYGFRPEMREVDPSSTYVVPPMQLYETDVSGAKQLPTTKSASSSTTEALYALPRSLLRKARGKSQSPVTVTETHPIESQESHSCGEVYERQARLSPGSRGRGEHQLNRRSPSPRLSPASTNSRLTARVYDEQEVKQRVTRF
ncbi:hypothetical protein QAD02_023619 [Eretmocerus hayati]|uniref:Uncharacterized protein n=1 Tax=Eretmocerus hayati TaxID=131215 RepID=A0ACC2Q192_9HYME|nr:hypothetical protein QAD02_023619 [Eretmocerus hayati]